MLLPEVTAFSIPAARDRYADCARAMGVATESDTDQSAVEKLLEELVAINEELNVPTPAQFGIDREKFFELMPTMAARRWLPAHLAITRVCRPRQRWSSFTAAFGNPAPTHYLNNKKWRFT